MKEKLNTYNEARDLANEANRAHDQVKDLEQDLTHAKSSIGRQALKKASTAKEHSFHQLVDAAGDKLAVANSTETTEAEVVKPETEATETIETAFEQKVEATRSALVEQYEKYGVKPEDFSLIETQNEDGEIVSTLVYSANSGLDLGDPAKENDEDRSYDSIMADDESHILELDGKKIDTRTGMTEEVYRAMIAHFKANNLPLPDTDQTKNKDLRTATWLTGDGAKADDAPIAFVLNNVRVYSSWYPHIYDSQAFRFRPAVVISR